MAAFWLAALLGLAGGLDRLALAADDHDDTAPLQVGYAIVTPIPATAGGLSVFETFGLKRGSLIDATAVLPSDLTTAASMFVSRSVLLDRNLGLAITNPNLAETRIDLTVRGANGLVMSQATLFLAGRRQVSQYVGQIFAGLPGWIPEFQGTLFIESALPVAILALRSRGDSFTTEPVTATSTGTPVPVFSGGVGGAQSVLLPQFVAGAGWATEILVVNTTASRAGVRLDFFKPDGSPMTVRLNGTSGSTFLHPNSIEPFGIMTFAPRDSNGNSRF
jgi:hypothetical protein